MRGLCPGYPSPMRIYTYAVVALLAACGPTPLPEPGTKADTSSGDSSSSDTGEDSASTTTAVGTGSSSSSSSGATDTGTDTSSGGSEDSSTGEPACFLDADGVCFCDGVETDLTLSLLGCFCGDPGVTPGAIEVEFDLCIGGTTGGSTA